MGQVESEQNTAIELAIINAHNTICEIKKVAPGSEFHIRTMKELTDLLASNPKALESFCKLQVIRDRSR